MISTQRGFDNLVFFVKNEGMSILTALDGNSIGNRTIKGEIGKQLPDTELFRGFGDILSIVKTTVMGTFIASFFMGSLFSSSFMMYIAMVRALQLALHLPLINVVFPLNAMEYISEMLPIAVFDYFDEAEWFEELFKPYFPVASGLD